MKDLPLLLRALEDNQAFGYAHFNDGEMQALDCNEGRKTVFAWMQTCTPKLSYVMKMAMTHTAPSFYLGLPCNCEFRGRYYLKALHVLNITHNLPYTWEDAMLNRKVHNDDMACPAHPAVLQYPGESARFKGRITVAPLFINGNYLRAKKELIRILRRAITEQKRAVHVVVAHGRRVDNLPITVTSVQHIAQNDAFEANYDEFRTPAFLDKAGYRDGDVVMIMAGPLGRILASEWTWLRPRITFLELGSFWDVELWNRQKHHLGQRRPCSARTDTVGLSCNHRWVHEFLPLSFPEQVTRDYLC
jgi:hypothetical protein